MIVPGNAGIKAQGHHAIAVGVNLNGDDSDGLCVATTGRFLLKRPPHLVVHSCAEWSLLLELMQHALDDP
jgi:hypothetical protein